MSEIDPREFGKLEAQVEALQAEVHALRQDIKTLLEMANKSKGGFFVGMAIACLGFFTTGPFLPEWRVPSLNSRITFLILVAGFICHDPLFSSC